MHVISTERAHITQFNLVFCRVLRAKVVGETSSKGTKQLN